MREAASPRRNEGVQPHRGSSCVDRGWLSGKPNNRSIRQTRITLCAEHGKPILSCGSDPILCNMDRPRALRLWTLTVTKNGSIRHSVIKVDRQLDVDHIPVLASASPLFRNVHHRQIQHFQKAIVCRENRLCFGHFTKLPVKASIFGKTASMAAENPVKLSVQAMKMSSTPRFLRPLSTVAQNLALSLSQTNSVRLTHYPQNVFPAVQVDSNGDIDCFLHDCKYRPESATCTRFERQATGEIAPPRRSRAPEGWNRFI